MSILAFGSSLKALAPAVYASAQYSADTTAGNLAPYCSEGVSVAPEAQPLRIEWDTGASEFWSSHYEKCAVSTSSTDVVLWIAGIGGTTLFRLTTSAAVQHELTAQAWTGSGWTNLASSSGANLNYTTIRKFDIYIKIADSGGRFRVKVNGTTQIDFTGDTLRTAETTCKFAGARGARGSTYASTISGFFAADEDAEAITYVQKRPNAAGSNSGWTGDYTAIDETGLDDSDFISSDAADEVSTFACAAVTSDFDSGYDVVAVGVAARARTGLTFSGDLQAAVHSGGDVGVSSTLNLTGGWASRCGFITTDPDTSAAWTMAAAKAAEVGVKSVA